MKKKLICAIIAASMVMSITPVAAEEAEQSQEITMLGMTVAGHGDWNEMWIFEEIERRFGVKFSVDQITDAGWNEKKNLVFASGDLPMTILGDDLTDTEIATYGAQGLLLPLEDYITPENMPNLFNIIENEPGYENVLNAMTYPDGHIYRLQGLSGAKREFAKSRFFINADWCEALGFEHLPTNLDEFYDYLVAVRDNDCNGNGDPDDEIPLGGTYRNGNDSYHSNFIAILAAFGLLNENYQVDENGQVIYTAAQENYKEFLKYMNKLYTENLLDPEYFTQTSEQRTAKQATNLTGAFTDYASWVSIPELEVSLQFRGMEPMTSEYNDTQMWPAKDLMLEGGFSITREVQDEETILKLLKIVDWWYSEEGTFSVLSGAEPGEDPDNPDYGWAYETDEKGNEIQLWNFDESKYDSYVNYIMTEQTPYSGYFTVGYIGDVIPVQNLQEEDYETDAATPSMRLTYDIVTNVYDYYTVDWPTTVRFTTEEASELSLIETDIKSYKETMESKMIKGDLDVEETWEEFQKGLKDRSLDRYLEILQQAYDRWLQG